MEKMESRMSKSERKVQISKSEESTFNNESSSGSGSGGGFGSIRARFDEEMRKMEEDMNKFRNQLMERERALGHDMKSSFSRPMSPTSTARRKASWIDDLDSPLIKDTIDGKMLKLKFDVTQYEPEEIIVKTIDNKLIVHAKHEEKSEHRSVYREYNREFLLPEGVNPEQIKSTLSKEGVLVVEAPLPKALQQDQGRTIPIKRT